MCHGQHFNQLAFDASNAAQALWSVNRPAARECDEKAERLWNQAERACEACGRCREACAPEAIILTGTAE